MPCGFARSPRRSSLTALALNPRYTMCRPAPAATVAASAAGDRQILLWEALEICIQGTMASNVALSMPIVGLFPSTKLVRPAQNHQNIGKSLNVCVSGRAGMLPGTEARRPMPASVGSRMVLSSAKSNGQGANWKESPTSSAESINGMVTMPNMLVATVSSSASAALPPTAWMQGGPDSLAKQYIV